MANCCLTSWAVAGPKDKIQALADKMLALVNEGRTSLVALLAACRVRSIDLDLRSEFSSVTASRQISSTEPSSPLFLKTNQNTTHHESV